MGMEITLVPFLLAHKDPRLNRFATCFSKEPFSHVHFFKKLEFFRILLNCKRTFSHPIIGEEFKSVIVYQPRIPVETGDIMRISDS
jgi:hypothetical protein